VIWTIGEALWDSTPAGLFLGGAPLNVAMHLRQLNVKVALISAVGDDRLGHELRRRLYNAGVDISLLGVHKSRETGFVLAELQDNGNARYTILQDVAWDLLPIVPMPDPEPPSALIYSSLVMRHDAGLTRLEAWFRAAPEAIRIFDVNLRAPHYTVDTINEQLHKADWIKANYEEAAQILGIVDATPFDLAVMIQSHFSVSAVLLTCDAAGAGVLMENEWLWLPAPKATVVDTIGAGDAFLAAFVAHYLIEQKDLYFSLSAALRRASKVVEYSGAVPNLR